MKRLTFVFVSALLAFSAYAIASPVVPEGGACRAAWDVCAPNCSCRGGYCTRTRAIPDGGQCNPGFGDSCAAGLICARGYRARPNPP